jgi:hypothetical protein
LGRQIRLAIWKWKLGGLLSLPIFQDSNKNFLLMQTAWASAVNPLLKNPINQGILLKEVALINGVTIINHLLGRTQQGWFVVDMNAAAAIYRSAAFNSTTLSLRSNAAVTVNLYVF